MKIPLDVRKPVKHKPPVFILEVQVRGGETFTDLIKLIKDYKLNVRMNCHDVRRKFPGTRVLSLANQTREAMEVTKREWEMLDGLRLKGGAK